MVLKRWDGWIMNAVAGAVRRSRYTLMDISTTACWASTGLFAIGGVLVIPMLRTQVPSWLGPMLPAVLALVIATSAWSSQAHHLEEKTRRGGGIMLRMVRLVFLPVSLVALVLSPAHGWSMLGCAAYTAALPLRALTEYLFMANRDLFIADTDTGRVTP